MDISQLLSQQFRQLEPPALREVTLKVAAVSGINLGQGVCQLPVPSIVIENASEAMKAGFNRYTNPRGLPELREAVANKLLKHNNLSVNPESEVLITCGATGGFEGVCATLINPGDEVITFLPSYPYHVSALKRSQAAIKYVDLQGDSFAFDEEELEKAFSERTKFIIINTPGNPSGKVFTREELECIGRLCEKYDCLAVTDEIYEYMVFDGRVHLSPACIPSLRARSITLGGYSKTFSITGWRIGFAAMPEALASPMAALLDSIYVCAPAPLQHAVASSINTLGESFYRELSDKYQQKRDFFAEALKGLGLKPHIPQGAYYMMVDYNQRYPDLESGPFVDMMIEKTGVGAVPSTDFLEQSQGAHWVRFCLAVEDSVLEEAIERLKKL